MYAIISEGGRQLKVMEGQQVRVDYRELSTGDAVTFDQVLALSNNGKVKLGTPTLSGASVSAEVVGIHQGEKLVVQKLRRRKTLRRKTGHRQLFTEVKITKITGA